jgi:hypothetical protein
MSTPFELTEIYVKELLTLPIEIAIKDLNAQLMNDNEVKGLQLVVAGGQAIQQYFPNKPHLRTHDYDLKLIAPKNVKFTPKVKARMLLLAKGIVRYFAIYLNRYIGPIYSKVAGDIKTRYGVDLLRYDNNDVFGSSTNLRTELLNTIPFRMQEGSIIRTNSIADVFVVDPSAIYHYKTFLGYSQSNQILSEGAGNYYIPNHIINGIPVAGLGYLFWDTLRMIEVSREAGLPKLDRYIDKKDAILNSLNNPGSNLSCNMMKDYMLKCESSYNSCNVDGQTYTNVSDLLKYAINKGLIPPDPEIITSIMNNFDIYYLCGAINRIK